MDPDYIEYDDDYEDNNEESIPFQQYSRPGFEPGTQLG